MNDIVNDLDVKIYVAGHRGMVGSAIVRELYSLGYRNIVTKTHDQLDLINQSAVEEFFRIEKPDIVYMAAAKVGGIHANNTYPANFIYENLMVQTNVIHQAFLNGVKRLLFLGSSCIYPKLSPQPIKEDALLTGLLEPTNEPYAIAKIAGIKMIESYNRQYGESDGIDYRSIMPTNLYGPGDNYHPENSHVIPGLIRRIHQAKVNSQESVSVWGTGEPKREFLYVDDLARASVLLMNTKEKKLKEIIDSNTRMVNVGFGDDISIKELVKLIAEIIEFKGEIDFDKSKKDGTPRKLLNSELMKNLGYTPKYDLRQGLKKTYEDYKKNIKL